MPRSTNTSLGSRSGAKIVIFGFGFLIRCQDIMNPWVWVVASVLRFDESMGEVQGENEEQGERRKKGENEEMELECLKLEYYVVPCGKLSTLGVSYFQNSRI